MCIIMKEMHTKRNSPCSLGTRYEIYRKNNTEIPVLELKKYVDQDTIANYQVFDVASYVDFSAKSS
jgi:hypothetical protein